MTIVVIIIKWIVKIIHKNKIIDDIIDKLLDDKGILTKFKLLPLGE